ncbi:hypothetical protein OAF54_03405, partial [bacterium]|nr:hypothetical protein [bacterium]
MPQFNQEELKRISDQQDATWAKISPRLAKTSKYNLEHRPDMGGITALQGRLGHAPHVLVGAGPTARESLGLLERNRDKFIITVCNRAAQWVPFAHFVFMQ